MSDIDVEREPFDPDKHFDPTKVSPSRVNKLSECGVAFKLYYLDQVPPPRMGSFALNGNVVHKALEKWSLDRSQDLLTLMRQAWVSQTEGTAVRDFLAEYQGMSASVLKAEFAAREAYNANPRNKGKTCQAPRMTKHFKESKACKDLNRLLARWLPKLEADSPWEFTERDPLPQFYDDSLVLAKRYEKQWGHLPPSLHTEFAFDVPWQGFRLVGYIDAIEMLVSPAGELQGISINDYKTYRREPAEQKDYRQLVIYDVAFRWLVENGLIQLPFSLDSVPVYVGIDYVRQAGVECDWDVLVPEGAETSGGNSRAYWQITDEDHEWLIGDLSNYRKMVEQRIFRPAAKSANPDFCDYGPLCCLRNAKTVGGCADRVEVAL